MLNKRGLSIRKTSKGPAGGVFGFRPKIGALVRALPRQIATSLLMAAAVPQPGLSKPRPNLRPKVAASNVWRARYMAGTITVEKRGVTAPLREESRVRVRFEENRILVFQKKRLVSIPAAAVSELDYRGQVYSRSRQVFGKEGASGAIGNCAQAEQAAALCVAMVIPMYAASAPFHYHEHFVHITWRIVSPDEDADDAPEQEMELRVGKSEFRSFIARLERATGKKCERIASNDSGQGN